MMVLGHYTFDYMLAKSGHKTMEFLGDKSSIRHFERNTGIRMEL
jgi:hypothetical protein